MNHLTLLLYILSISAQTPDPVKWTFSSKKLDSVTYEIHLKAAIVKGWHMYSLYNEGGPGPSSVHFDRTRPLKLVGDLKEIGKLERRHEKIFDAEVRGFSSSVDFVQPMQRKDTGTAIVTGIVKFIACNGTRCLPPKELAFSVTVK